MERKIESPTQSPYEEFVAAVKRGDAEAVRRFLDAHEGVRARIDEPLPGTFDAPPVHLAKKNLALLDVLLSHGADLNQRTRWWAGGFGVLESDCTPEQADALIARGADVDVWAAAHLGRIDDLRRLIEPAPSLVNARGGDGKTPLHCAANVEVARYLIDRSADLEARDVDHESTPLQYLIDKPKVARLLIERGARVDVFAAAALGDVALLERCIAEDPSCPSHRLGAPPWVMSSLKAGGHIYNWTLGHGVTPLDVARRHGREDAAYQFLSSRSPAKTRFLEAIWRGDSDAAQKMLDDWPGLIGELTEDDRQMLPRAAWAHEPAAVRLMLELGFDPHVTGVDRSTPLDRAAFHGYADIVEMLLRFDPNPPLAQTNAFGGTPLGACLHGWQHGWKTGHPQDHARTVQLLLDAGAQFDAGWLPIGRDDIDNAVRAMLRQRGGKPH